MVAIQIDMYCTKLKLMGFLVNSVRLTSTFGVKAWVYQTRGQKRSKLGVNFDDTSCNHHLTLPCSSRSSEEGGQRVTSAL